ncbi:kinetochore-associated protein NSL1 homolog [Rhinophrynus dorsalis]
MAVSPGCSPRRRSARLKLVSPDSSQTETLVLGVPERANVTRRESLQVCRVPETASLRETRRTRAYTGNRTRVSGDSGTSSPNGVLKSGEGRRSVKSAARGADDARSSDRCGSKVPGDAGSHIRSHRTQDPGEADSVSESKALDPVQTVSSRKSKAFEPVEAASSRESKVSHPVEAVSSSEGKVLDTREADSSSKGKLLEHEQLGSSNQGTTKNSGKAGSTSECKVQGPRETVSSHESKALGLQEVKPSYKSEDLGCGQVGPINEGISLDPGEVGSVRESKVLALGDTGSSAESKVNSVENGSSRDNRAQDTDAASNTQRLSGPEELAHSDENGPCFPVEENFTTVCGAQGIGDAGAINAKATLHGGEADSSGKDIASVSEKTGSSGESRDRIPVEAGCSTGVSSDSINDFRVRCCSKQIVQEVLEMCTEFSKEVIESQQQLNQGRKEEELRKCIWDFERAFQENISINGQSWDEASETQNEPALKILEDKLDAAIVDAAMKRKRYPRKILAQFVKMLKTEREVLAQYKPVVNPEDFMLGSGHDTRMLDLAAVTTTLSQQISETMKALPAQIEKAEGFSQVLSIQPVLEGSQIRKDIFSRVILDDLAKKLPKPLETTPTERESQATAVPVLSRRRKRSLSPEKRLYPLRSKRKISLHS